MKTLLLIALAIPALAEERIEAKKLTPEQAQRMESAWKKRRDLDDFAEKVRKEIAAETGEPDRSWYSTPAPYLTYSQYERYRGAMAEAESARKAEGEEDIAIARELATGADKVQRLLDGVSWVRLDGKCKSEPAGVTATFSYRSMNSGMWAIIIYTDRPERKCDAQELETGPLRGGGTIIYN